MNSLEPIALTNATVFCKTDAGRQEVDSRGRSLHQRYRRTLIIVDGIKDLAEISVLLRPDEIEVVFPHLLALGLIEPVSAAELADNGERILLVPAARDPLVFADIRAHAVQRVRDVFGSGADYVAGEIEGADSADEMRIKLRELEDIFTSVLGKDNGRLFAREIGHPLLALVPRMD